MSDGPLLAIDARDLVGSAFAVEGQAPLSAAEQRVESARTEGAALSALRVDSAAHVWNLAALGWGLRGSTTTLTVPIGEFTVNEVGDVVVWDSAVAGALFEALRTDSAIPQQVIDAQP